MNKSNKILLGVLSFVVVCVVGYALFSEKITVTGTATASGNFDINYTCQTGLANVDGIYHNAFNSLNGQETENSYSDDSCSIVDNQITFKTKLTAPGAMRYYTIKVTNDGSIPAWAPFTPYVTTEACMGSEMVKLVSDGYSSFTACRSLLFNSADSNGNSSSIEFEDLSFASIIEKDDGTLIDLYQIPEEEAMTYLDDDLENVKMEPGWKLYYVGKMYIPTDYQYTSSAYNGGNMIDFDLSATYTLEFIQQTN